MNKIFISNIKKTTQEDFEKFLNKEFGKIDEIKYYQNRNIAYLTISNKDIYDKIISSKSLKYLNKYLKIKEYIQKKHYLHIYNIPERFNFSDICKLFDNYKSIITISLDYNNRTGICKNTCNIILNDFEEYKKLLDQKDIKINDNEIIHITKRIQKRK